MPQSLSELRPNQGLQKEVVVLLFSVVCAWLEGGELYGVGGRDVCWKELGLCSQTSHVTLDRFLNPSKH